MQFLLAAADGTIWNALRVALGIFSGKNIYNFAILENLRIFQIYFFTGGVVEGNGICSAALCESAALRASVLALSGANAPALPKGEPLAKPYTSQFNR